MTKTIYFDNAATTPVSANAAAKALEVMTQRFANPSSVHNLGAGMEREVQSAAETIADLINARPDEIIFTSGGTEANNLAVMGAARAYRREGTHILTSATEHASVEQAMKALEQDGFTVTRTDNVLSQLRGDTILVSLIHVNNETGAITDVAEIARQIKKKRPGIVIHTDGVQGFCKHPLDLKNIDLYTMSAHKIHGMKGSGALFIKKGIKLKPLLFGGGQQKKLRPGTENTPGILSMAVAASEYQQGRVGEIRKILLEMELEDVFVNGSPDSPFILNMSFMGVKGETLVHALESENIIISTGAACGSKQRKHSTLIPMGFPPERVESAVRFSFSGWNTTEEAQICKEALIRLVPQLRRETRRRRV